MAHIKNRLRGLLAAFVALVAALAIVPGVARAAATESFNLIGSISISSTDDHFITSDNTFTVKKVAEVKRDPVTNETDVVAVDGVEQNIVDTWVTTNNAQNAQELADAAESLISLDRVESDAVVGTSYMVSDDADGVVLSPFTPGVYLIQIDNTEADTFQNIIATVGVDVNDEGDWIAVGDEIEVKASSPDDFQKNVVNPDNPDEILDSEGTINAAPGETFTFKVSFKLNSNMSSYTISDTMTNMTFDSDFGVKLYTVDGTPVNDNWQMDTPTADGAAFSLTIENPAAMIDDNDDQTEYYILYKATVDDSGTVADGASNAAHDNQQGSDTIDVRFAGLKIFKVDGSTYELDSYDETEMESATKLDGAKFTLYRESNNQDGLQQTSEGGDTVVTDQISTTGGVWSTDDNNILLDPDATYYLVETAAPNGYVLPDDTLVATLKSDSNNLVADHVFNLVLKNTKGGKDQGIDLPSTGGVGTVALTAAGVVLVAGAAAFIVRSRKQN